MRNRKRIVENTRRSYIGRLINDTRHRVSCKVSISVHYTYKRARRVIHNIGTFVFSLFCLIIVTPREILTRKRRYNFHEENRSRFIED